MAVRMAGIEVIDRDPIEPGAEIPFHLPHHVAGEAAQVREPIAILGRNNEAELVAVPLAPRWSTTSTKAGVPTIIRSIGSRRIQHQCKRRASATARAWQQRCFMMLSAP
jgi:hypothetical protein